MDRQIEPAQAATKAGTTNGARPPHRSGHLMCRTPLWGVAGFLGCAYFAWVSFNHVAQNEYDWPHDWWTAVTYVVWILLLGALAFDTSCVRERIFFVLLLINFVAGCGLTLWYNIPFSSVRIARIGTGALWAVAALVSLTTLEGMTDSGRTRV